MQISFGKGFVYLPDKKIFVNPDKITTIREDEQKKTDIYVNGNESIRGVESPAIKIVGACLEAQLLNICTKPNDDRKDPTIY